MLQRLRQPLTSVSPGTTGRLKRQFSIPPKKNCSLASWLAGSSITSPPSCAIASICSTPAGADAWRARAAYGRDACVPSRARACCASAARAHLPHAHARRRTGHDGALREVAVEELVIDRDVLVADGELAVLNLHHAVHQQEGVPAGVGGTARRRVQPSACILPQRCWGCLSVQVLLCCFWCRA